MSAMEYVCTFANGQLVPMSELVRCRDCKHWESGTMDIGLECNTQPDHYCSDGVRRDKA